MNKNSLFAIVMLASSTPAIAQIITVDVPTGYKVVVVPSSVTVAQAITVYNPAPQSVNIAPNPVYHQRARHVASVGEGMVIEHQIDDHH